MIDGDVSSGIACLCFHFGTGTLLIPNSVVAEVVSQPALRVNDSCPEYDLAIMQWRGGDVTLLRGPRGEESQESMSLRAVVVYGLEEGDRLSHYALEARSVPRLLRVDSQDPFTSCLPNGTKDWPGFRVVRNSREYYVPDLIAIEARLFS